MLFTLMLLLVLFDRLCPGRAFDKRELCRFIGGMKGSAPGTVSSVSPARAFGALARNEGVSLRAGDKGDRSDVGEAVHVQPGELCN